MNKMEKYVDLINIRAEWKDWLVNYDTSGSLDKVKRRKPLFKKGKNVCNYRLRLLKKRVFFINILKYVVTNYLENQIFQIASKVRNLNKLLTINYIEKIQCFPPK